MDEYIVEMDHISKSFFGVKVLDDVSLHLKAGEVLALLGENGAGKSTLINILSGVYTRDEGEIRLFGKPVGDLSPKQAQEMGIAVIHQEMNLCRHLSVMENVFLGCEESHRGVIQKKEMTEKTRKILDRLHLDIDPSQTVGGLSVSKQQMVEIARALSENARVLIMDEPTSALSSNEIDDLFRIIRRLKAEGCGIIYISHRLEELSEIADRVQIMRDGRFIISRAFRDITMPEIISNMVGREIKEKFPRVEAPKGKKIFEVQHLNAGRLVRDVSLDLHAGEIVGVAGLVGAGRSETMRAIFGADPKETGRIFVDGREVTIRRPIDAIRAGIMLVPEDRRKDGLCIKQSVMFNISLPNLDLLAGRLGKIDRKKEREMTRKCVDGLKIRLSSPAVNASTLSGGNQQKVVVAKWLARRSRVVIFDEPTRGIDVAAKVEIYNLMNDLKKRGIGVLFVSSEMPEILGISDRILVMCEGRITGEMPVEDATQSLIMEYATKSGAEPVRNAG